MQLRFGAATDTGRVRDHNEDNFLVDQNLDLFVVCDGMGGHAAGEVASAVCVRTVRDVIAAEKGLLCRLEEVPKDKGAVESLKQLLRHSVQMACRRIFEMAQKDPSRRGMGTTCVALVLVGGRGFVGHVGDSRMYRIRRGEIDQITDDHSLLNEMIRQGKVPPDTSEATFPHKNAVTRAVGVRETVDVDAFAFDVEAGDRLVMCSDGLSEYFDESVDLMALMGSAEPEETTTRCIDFANASGGKDNITVIAIDCDPQLSEEKESGPEREEVIEILRTTPYFHYLAPAELEQIRQMASRLDVDADEDVVGDDEDNDRLYLILKGSVSLQLDGEQVSVLTTGEHFGEMALIDAQDEKDTNLVARTVEPSVFLTVERDQFVGLLRSEPGLAIKLLWNFVQVFADRLQSVPPEYRYTPDEWRSDPEAIADVTPPSGTLVFEEDLERMEKGDIRPATSVGSDELSDPQPPDLPEAVTGKDSRVTSSADPPPMMEAGAQVVIDTPDDSEEDLRETVSLKSVNRKGVDTLPPGIGREQGDSSEDDTPSVEFNPRMARREEANPSVDAGLSSGTYDQSLLEEGASSKTNEVNENGENVGRSQNSSEPAEEGPTVTINRRETRTDAAQTPTETQNSKSTSSATKSDDRADLKRTMKLDWSAQQKDTPPLPEAGATGDSLKRKRKGKGGKTVEGRTPKTDEPASVSKKRLNSGERQGPVPSSEILKKASRSNRAQNGEGGKSQKEGGEEKHSKESDDSVKAVSGRSEVVVDESEGETGTSDEPKVMIASDLVVDAEDEDS